MKKVILSVAALAALTIVSCESADLRESEENTATQQNFIISEKGNSTKEFDDLFVDKKDINKRLFSEALVASLNQSKKLRQIIKDEALRRFNMDTEVLYVLIMDKVTENGSVQDLMASNTEGGIEVLKDILEQDPTMTILVPTLPEKTFSAERWDTDNVIPAVGIRLLNTNNVPLIWNTGNEEVLSAEMIPGFPALAVKSNERLITSRDARYDDLKTNVVYNAGGPNAHGPAVFIRYSDINYDGEYNGSSSEVGSSGGFGGFGPRAYTSNRTIDPALIDAYEHYEVEDGWQRDYIYYGIYPDTAGEHLNGPFIFDYSETIGEFQLTGDPEAAYDNIADQTGDAEARSRRDSNNWSAWTDGSFDIMVNILATSISGAGDEVILNIPFGPEDLFELEYSRQYEHHWVFWTSTYYKLESKTLLNSYIAERVIPWDLEQKAAEWDYKFTEVDNSETVKVTETNTQKYAVNFSWNQQLGKNEKNNIQFGAQGSQDHTSTVERTTTLVSDVLGNTFVSFGDKVITGSTSELIFGNYYNFRHFSTGSVRFTVEPVLID